MLITDVYDPGVTFPPLRRRVLTSLGLIAACAMLPGCAALGEMEFVQDDSIRITAPENLSTISLPGTVSWERAASDEGHTIAVFLDRYPMPPGESLRDLLDEEDACRGNDTCLQPQNLAQIFGIYLSDSDEVTINALPLHGPTDGESSHYATLVPLDDEGVRVGESVWYVSFQVAS